MVDVDQLSIGEVAEKFDVTHRTLRFYEQRQLLNPIKIGQTRYYDSNQIERLKVIIKGKNLGFTLSEIADLCKNRKLGKSNDSDFIIDHDTVDTQLILLEKRRDEINDAIIMLKAAQLKRDNRV